MTSAFWAIVDANRAPEEGELADILDKLDKPDAVTLDRLREAATGDMWEWLKDRKNRRAIPYRMDQCGYSPVRNDAAQDGLWKIDGARQTIYAKSTLSKHARSTAARKLANS